jgi:hypothetical protein
MRKLLAAIVLLFASAGAFAHTSGSSFLALRAEGESIIHVEWDFDVRDLHQSLQLDDDGDGTLTWAEILAARPAIESLVLARTHLSSAARACTLASTDVPAIAEHGDGPYLRFIAAFTCPPGTLALDHCWNSKRPMASVRKQFSAAARRGGRRRSPAWRILRDSCSKACDISSPATTTWRSWVFCCLRSHGGVAQANLPRCRTC